MFILKTSRGFSILRTFGHVLCDDVDGLLGHHRVKRHQLVVSELLHDLSLLEESFWRHGARLQGLDGHLGGTVPSACKGVGGGSMSVENNSYEQIN